MRSRLLTCTLALSAVGVSACRDFAGYEAANVDARRDTTAPDTLAPDTTSPLLTPPDVCGSYNMPGFSKVCATSSDCVAIEHIADCCGSKVVWGIAKSELFAFATAEGQCKTFRPLCNCPALPPKLEDGNSYQKLSSIRVTCLAGVCRTEHRCGGPCSSNNQCFRCGSAGFCSTSCTIGPQVCLKFETCIPSNDSEQFCAPQGISSCP